MPICAFDIDDTGQAAPAGTGPVTSGYRWLHFDLADPDLPAFLSDHVADIPAAGLLAPETRPRCDPYADGLILNLRGVNMNNDGPVDQMVAVRIWVTKTLLITVQARHVVAVDELRHEAEAGAAPANALTMVGQLARRLMRRVRDTVFDLSDRVDVMEDTVVDDDAPLPHELAEERRMAIRLRRYLGPQRDALDALVLTDSALMTDRLRAQMREQANLAKLAVEELDALVARMTAVQDHHTAQAALKQGHNGYVLSIVAAVFLPLGFITGLFGVNVAGMPGVGTPWAFAALCAAMVVISVAALWLMRRLKWI
ncbi:CorA family divalent cation transporter [uncultured Tateyamaria sp.]|uniref:CorA family divalent cation transporter n=1 Tax=Tateyamaria sp. 1078 TaxID=3417464 RepID=UPI00260607A0|nr:CorA family divalent cation transporter [uncultured Tateyamaria sp.]